MDRGVRLPVMDDADVLAALQLIEQPLRDQLVRVLVEHGLRVFLVAGTTELIEAHGFDETEVERWINATLARAENLLDPEKLNEQINQALTILLRVGMVTDASNLI